MTGLLFGQQPNPRLRNFKYGTGKASWWENKQATPRVFYYPPSVRYYQPRPYYNHFMYCHCHICTQRRAVYQWQLNPQRFFFFQFRF